MTTDDVEASRAVQARAFAGPDDPTDPATFPPEVTARQLRRINHFLTHDGPGSWVAANADRGLGIPLALRCDDLRGLWMLAVRPDCKAKGSGQQLVEGSFSVPADAERSVILSTSAAK